MILKNIERYLIEILRERKLGFIPSLIKFLLLPLSLVYRFVVKTRNALYDLGFMRRYIPPVPLVISIGNIVVGGTGKTPLTLLIANAFYDTRRIAILSRGYRSKVEKLDSPVTLCEGDGPIFPASYCGDEPYLFAQRLPKAMVIVGRDRKKASLTASRAGVQVILLDDALQHRSLGRDFDVIIVDVKDPFGSGNFLPRGFLREDVTALSRANLIVLNHVKDFDEAQKVKNKIKAYSDAPIVSMNSSILAIRDLKGIQIPMPDHRRVGMFCAIARPEYFRQTLENHGFEVVAEYFLPDHLEIREKKLEQFAQTSLKNGAQWLICTEKDRVKLHDHTSLSLPVLWLQMELQVVEGIEDWNHFLNLAQSKID